MASCARDRHSTESITSRIATALARSPAASASSIGTCSLDSTPPAPTTLGSDRHTSPDAVDRRCARSPAARRARPTRCCARCAPSPGRSPGWCCPCRAMILYAAVAHLLAEPVELVGGIRPPSGPTTSSSGVPPTVADDHSTISLSPCSPTIEAWTLVDADAEPLGEEVAQPRRVEHGAAADDPAVRQAGDLLGDVRDDVDGVRDEQVDGVRRDLEQRRQRAADERDVGAGEVEPGPPGPCVAPAVTTTRSASAHTPTSPPPVTRPPPTNCRPWLRSSTSAWPGAR